MNIQKIHLSKLVLNTGQINGLPKNPRFIKDEKFNKLKQSLIDDPEMLDLRELIVYPFGNLFVVIAGNMRFRAAQELKYETLPCKVLSPKTPVEKLKAVAIKDNIGYGEHDWDCLANEWDEDQLTDWGLDLPISNTDVNLDDFFGSGPETADKKAKICPHCGKNINETPDENDSNNEE